MESKQGSQPTLDPLTRDLLYHLDATDATLAAFVQAWYDADETNRQAIPFDLGSNQDAIWLTRRDTALLVCEIREATKDTMTVTWVRSVKDLEDIDKATTKLQKGKSGIETKG